MFVTKYVNFYLKSGSSNLIGWKLGMGVALDLNLFSMTRVAFEINTFRTLLRHEETYVNLKMTVSRKAERIES